MYPVPAPPNTSAVGEEEEEHHEKKPVLKKVKDKMKKIKNAISKKSHDTNEGEDNDHNGLQDDEEIDEDTAVHGVPTNERSAAGAGIVPQEMAGGRGEGTKGAGNVSDFINMDEFYRNKVSPRTDSERETRIQQNQEFENPSTEGVGDGLRLTTEKFVGDLTPPTIEAEKNTESEQSRAYESPTTNEMSRGWEKGAEGVDGGLGMIKEESVENPGAPKTEEAYVSPATFASSGANERSTGELKGGETSHGVNDNFGLITDDLIKEPTTPKADDEANARNAWSQVHLSPTSDARTGLNDLSEREVDDAKGFGDGLSLTTMELAEDPAAPKTEAEVNTNTEQTRGTNEAKLSPDLCRSLEAMTVSAPAQNKRLETEPPKSTNKSYTAMVSSAASKMYEMVSDAGTAVISKVKPAGTNHGEGEAAENQEKGISFKEYIAEKLTPGEDEKALSELITDGGQKKKNEAVEVPRREGNGAGEGERGVGVVGKIRETVSSLLGGGQVSPKSLQADSHRKVAEDNADLHSRPSEAI